MLTSTHNHEQPRRWDQGSRQAVQEPGCDSDPVLVADFEAVLALLKPLLQLSDRTGSACYSYIGDKDSGEGVNTRASLTPR